MFVRWVKTYLLRNIFVPSLDSKRDATGEKLKKESRTPHSVHSEARTIPLSEATNSALES